MDTIHFAVKFETPPAARNPELAMEAFINGEVVVSWTAFPIDVLALQRSAHEPGEHFIWTCSCGVPECGGIHNGILVSHTPDAVVWKVPVIPFKHAGQYEFAKSTYVAAVTISVNEYIKYFKAYRAAGIPFDAGPDWQIAELLASTHHK